MTDYTKLICELRLCATKESPKGGDTCTLMWKAALAIANLSEVVEGLRNEIYNALDGLDRGVDNDWAREALERAVEEYL